MLSSSFKGFIFLSLSVPCPDSTITADSIGYSHPKGWDEEGDWKRQVSKELDDVEASVRGVLEKVGRLREAAIGVEKAIEGILEG
ncbi:hypothetical protein NL676_005693 [Syzygium grande]|nr:hypothetical protein NL676_005693 [Syzygium grande]